MKKFTAILTIALAAVAALCSAEEEFPGRLRDGKTYPFLLGIFPSWPKASHDYDVLGFKLGAPICDGVGTVYGLEASVLYSGTDYVKGVQATLSGISRARMMRGVQACAGGNIATQMQGFQAGISNVAIAESCGCQASVANIAWDFTGFQAALVNISADKMIGFQFGAANIAGESTGCQTGLVNTASGESDIWQIGVVNVSSKKGFQLGFINVIPDGWIPVMLLVNFKF